MVLTTAYIYGFLFCEFQLVFYISTTEKDMSLNFSNAHGEHNETHLPSTPNHLSPPGSTRASDDRILIVDWDGPDDPENPRKYA
jgi:hypothetical protein